MAEVVSLSEGIGGFKAAGMVVYEDLDIYGFWII